VGGVVGHRLFGVDEARALLPEVRRRVDALVEARADLTELSVGLRRSGSSSLGGLAEMKALQARLDDMLEWFRDEGIELKGVAPFLIDFPPPSWTGCRCGCAGWRGSRRWPGTTDLTSALPDAAGSLTEHAGQRGQWRCHTGAVAQPYSRKTARQSFSAPGAESAGGRFR
jgi:hypothetical protein